MILVVLYASLGLRDFSVLFIFVCGVGCGEFIHILCASMNLFMI